MADSQQDKTEQPTRYRLEEARERGQVARSAELTGVLVMAAFAVAFVVTASRVAGTLAGAMQASLLLAGSSPIVGTGLLHWLGRVYGAVAQALMPALFAMLIAAVAGNLAQTGVVFSATPMTPDWSRLNPAQGFKRIFSRRMLWELGKLIGKVAVLAVMAWWAFGHLDGWADTAALATPHALPTELVATFVHAATWILVGFGALALLDLLFVRRDYLRKLRMSRRDLKDESKRREGDPEVRSRRRRLVQELLKRTRAVGRVAEADVVLSNPTHLSVALQYRPSTMRAPIVVAKGTDGMALRMREIAWRAGVPQLQSPELARALFRACRIDAPVPEELFTQLGPIYRWLMARPGHRIA